MTGPTTRDETRRYRNLGLLIVIGVLVLYGAAWLAIDPLAGLRLPTPEGCISQSPPMGPRLLRWRSVVYELGTPPEQAGPALIASLQADGWQPQGDTWQRDRLELRLHIEPRPGGGTRAVALVTRH